METKTYQFTVDFDPDEDGVIIATVPALPRGTMRQILKDIGMSVDEFRNLLYDVD